MALTAPQQLILKNYVEADVVLNALPHNNGGALEIANTMNADTNPAFIVWRSSVSWDTIMGNGIDWARVDNLQNGGKFRIWEWMFKNATNSINPSKANIRTGITTHTDDRWRESIMYPRNAASPEPIAIGAVVQISDGAVQTSGVTVRIKPIGVAEANGGNAAVYSTDGIVYYTPTQVETNYTSFILIAKKTGCIPISATVITTESEVPGRVSIGMVAGDSIAAANLAKSASAIVTGTVTSGANTISIPTLVISPSGSSLDQFKGRIMIFLRDTATAGLRAQASNITSSTASATPTFTVSPFSTAPASGDVFVIV